MVVFRKGGIISYDDSWFYGDTNLEVVDVINYLVLIYHVQRHIHIQK